MGFSCPACGDPQADADHLANHLAFTALLRGGDHEAWLDERVPGWEDLDEASLGERVTEYADERAFPQVFEDTTDGHPDARDSADHAGDRRTRGPRGAGDRSRPLDGGPDVADGTFADDADDVLETARELTRQRHADDGPGSTDDSETE